MNTRKLLIVATMLGILASSASSATTELFGSGPNQFTIDFVSISGDATGANGTPIGACHPDQAHQTRQGHR